MAVISSTGWTHRQSPGSVRLSRLCKIRECEQAAAVCYRLRRDGIEFLLVQTRGRGRWTFPKGKAEPGLTHAQAAAIEAFEEAGVHGRIEEASFLRYVCRRQNQRNGGRSAAKSILVSAHLCEVLRLGSPKETNRNRTWFSVEGATERLREGRKNDDGEEFARVIQQAVARIQLCKRATETAAELRPGYDSKDELHRVQFEALPKTHLRLNPRSRFKLTGDRALAHETLPCEVLPFAAPRNPNRNPKLLSGAVKVKASGSGTKNG
jgi:8-oxo-dGTP pyrophosphatase MutT (NUDIX family)